MHVMQGCFILFFHEAKDYVLWLQLPSKVKVTVPGAQPPPAKGVAPLRPEVPATGEGVQRNITGPPAKPRQPHMAMADSQVNSGP